MILDLLFMFGPGLAGLFLQVFFWRSLPQVRRGAIAAGGGRLVKRNIDPALFFMYVAVWITVFVLSFVLLFWSIIWFSYIVEYQR